MRALPAAAAFSIALAAVGCGPAVPQFKTAAVAGTVTYKGKPVTNATVQFHPVGNPSAPASNASTDASGAFTASGAAGPGVIPGKYKVTVSGYAPGSLPAKYANVDKTLIEVTIPEAGDPALKLELKD